MQKILTRDQSETFLSPEYNESYHSFTGAVEEALKKFCEPTNISKLAKEKGNIVLLDFCFGMGYNSAMAISQAREANPNCSIKIIGLEKDPRIIEKIQEVDPNIPYFKYYKELSPEKPMFEDENNQVSVQLILGDAKEKVKELKDNHFDIIFFDPFSPKTQPEMWSAEVFKELKRVMKEGALLATYSCARVVRDNMKAAGLRYKDGPKVGRRGPGTLAWKE